MVEAVSRYQAALDPLETRLAARPYLCGDAPSLADVAWAINLNRLELCGFPLSQRYPRLGALLTRLKARPAVARAFQLEMPVPLFRAGLRAVQWLKGTTLPQAAGLEKKSHTGRLLSVVLIASAAVVVARFSTSRAQLFIINDSK